MFWGSGGPDRLYAADSVTHLVEWSSLSFEGPFHGLAHGDVDADGQPELLLGSARRPSYNSGYLLRYDTATRRLESALETDGYGELWRVAVANVDADPQLEIFTTSTREPYVACRDGLTGAIQWQTSGWDEARALAVADVDLDGQLEVVIVLTRSFSTYGSFVQVYSAASGALEWESPDLDSSSWLFPFLRIANVDADPQPEIVAARFDGGIFVVDGVNHLTNALGDHDVTALDVADRNGDGRAEIVVGTDDGEVRVVDVNGQVVEVLGDFGLRVQSLLSRDVNGDGAPDLLLGLGNELRIHEVGGALLWRSGLLGATVGALDGLRLANIDQDAYLEIVADLGYGAQIFEVRPATGALPTLSVSDASAVEGDDWYSGLVAFTLTLSAPLEDRVIVDYSTAPGTASPYSEYDPVSGVVVFEEGATTKVVRVPIHGDTYREPDETFFLNLSNASNAVLADGQATGTILNDEPPEPPVIGINPASVTEGHTGVTNAVVIVTLSGAASQTVTVSYSAVPASGSATSGIDFGAVFGTLTFPPGASSQSIAVPVFGDRVLEGAETFQAVLSGAVGGYIGNGSATVTIQDDDAAGLTVNDVVVRERVGGTASAVLRVTLAPPASGPVTVDYSTVNGTATAGSDYVAASGILTFAPGEATRSIPLTVNPDALLEGPETFTVNLSGALGAGIAHGTGTVRILDRPADGDFDQDGRTDLVWRHDSSGQIALWYMDGATLLSGTLTDPPALPDPGWKIVGTNDFNLDGQPDILWRHAISGENVLWYMDGATLESGTFLDPPALVDMNWRMAGTADFNLDGSPDILWRHAVSGQIVVWHMNGAVLQSGTFLTPSALTDVGWTAAATGDFNRDGSPDILWHHGTTGDIVVWFLNGTGQVSGYYTSPNRLADVNWRIVATGDYDQDGKVDIVWRHSVSGQNAIWFMDGLTLQSGALTQPGLADTGWKIVGPR